MLFENESQKALEIPPPIHHRPAPMILRPHPLCTAFAAVVALAWGFGSGAAHGQAATVEELRASIDAIVEAQTLASRETRDWEARKATMADLLDIHRREIALLTEELESSGRSVSGHDEAVATAKADIAALRATRAKLTAAVESSRPRLLAIAARFPAPLTREIEPDLATLNAWTPSDEPREPLQAILSILTKAAQFNRRISRSLESIDGREVEVLYLGLARAFYADRSGNAGTGVPGPEAWSWQADPSINREVLRAFEILDQKRPPSRVELPLQVE
jgi:hypothetical protein